MADRLVTLVTCQSPFEAALLQHRLEERGIKSSLTNEALVGNFSLLANAVGGIKLQVFERDLQQAEELLDELEAESSSPAAESDVETGDADDVTGDLAPDDETDNEEDEVDGGEDVDPLNARELKVDRAFKSAIIGMFFCPLQLYTGWLVLNVFLSDEPLREASRNRFVVAAIFFFIWFIGAVLAYRLI